MSKFNFYFIALASLSILFSCNKSDDDVEVVPVRGYSEQYVNDSISIETFLKKHYIKEIIDNPGNIDDQDIIFGEIDNTISQVPVWDSPMLHSFVVEKHDISYRVYYLQLREGVGEAPSRVDKVLTAYEGSYLFSDTKEVTIDGVVIPAYNTTSAKIFETVQIPTSYLPLHSTITGFSEVFPYFKPGEAGVENPGNPASYLNFGAGVMFIPSGLAYFNYATATIPAYAPLLFKFKFYAMERDDYDADGILSIDEDIDHDQHFDNDDTDGDGIQNYMDADDDGDGYNTKIETRYTDPTDPFNTVSYYPYNGAAVDDPATLYINETYGIPRKFTGPIDPETNLPTPVPADYTDPARLRRHLDPTAH